MPTGIDMQTDELITSLTRELPATSPHALTRLLSMGLLIGVAGSLLIFFMGYGVRTDLGNALHSWPFWMKWTYAISMALSAYLVCEKLARPGIQLDWLLFLPLLPAIMLLGVALQTLWNAPIDLRSTLLLGHSYWFCPLNIGLLSLPVFAALCHTLRRAAPTRLRLTGFIAGLLAGAIATFIYCLFCTETSVAFVATWYSLGMLLPALLGALYGRTLLRWT
jgi:hypothetical protein